MLRTFLRLLGLRRTLIAVLAGAGVFMASPATAENTKDLVERATRRMDAAIAQIRRTGNVRDVVAEFMAAEADFRKAWEILAISDRAQAVLPLVRSADCLRISQQWDAAQARYEEGLALARE